MENNTENQVKTLKQTLAENAEFLPQKTEEKKSKPNKRKFTPLKITLIISAISSILLIIMLGSTYISANPVGNKQSEIGQDKPISNQNLIPVGEAEKLIKKYAKDSMSKIQTSGVKADYKTLSPERALENKVTVIYAPDISSQFEISYIDEHPSDATSTIFNKDNDIFSISKIDFSNYVTAEKKGDTITLYNDNKVHTYSIKIDKGLITEASRSKPMGTSGDYKDSYLNLKIVYSLTPEERTLLASKIPQ